QVHIVRSPPDEQVRYAFAGEPLPFALQPLLPPSGDRLHSARARPPRGSYTNQPLPWSWGLKQRSYNHPTRPDPKRSAPGRSRHWEDRIVPTGGRLGKATRPSRRFSFGQPPNGVTVQRRLEF